MLVIILPIVFVNLRSNLVINFLNKTIMAELTFDDLKLIISSVSVDFDALLYTVGENEQKFTLEEIKNSREQWKKFSLLFKLLQMFVKNYAHPDLMYGQSY